MNSYGFNGEIPEGAIAGMYDILNGEWTGQFFFTEEEIKTAKLLDHYSIEMIEDEEF